MTREEKNNIEKKHGATWLQVCKIFARNYERSPEADLLFSVISQAVWDIFNSREAERDDAIRFFKEGRHHVFCDLIGLNGQWVSEIMRDYAGVEYGSATRPYQQNAEVVPSRSSEKSEIIRLFDAGKIPKEIASALKITTKHVRKTLIDASRIVKEHCDISNLNIRPVVQISPEGEILSEFKSVSEAARVLGISNEGVRMTCHGKRKSAGGFRFRFMQ